MPGQNTHLREKLSRKSPEPKSVKMSTNIFLETIFSEEKMPRVKMAKNQEKSAIEVEFQEIQSGRLELENAPLFNSLAQEKNQSVHQVLASKT